MKLKNMWFRGVSLACACLLGIGSYAATVKVVVNGVNFDCDTKKGTAKVAKYSTGSPYTGNIVVPEKVTASVNGSDVEFPVVETAANCFLDCVDVTSIQLPESCVTIGRNSFKGCTGLTVSPIPATATSVGTGVFNGCSSIEEITIPVGWAGPMVSEDFAGCSSLKRLIFADSELDFVMNSDAFGKTAEDKVADKTLEYIYFGRNVAARAADTNNQQPFHNLSALKKVEFAANFTTITGTMFQGCTALEDVVFAEGSNVTSLGASAFQSCTGLQAIALPDGITSIPVSAFYNCTSLASLSFGNAVTSIGEGAFANTKALKSVEFPATLSSLAKQAFDNSGLEGELALPDALTSIGASAFANTKLTSIAIPAGVSSIGVAAFAPITTLEAVSVAEGNEKFKVTDGILTSANGKRLLVTAHQAADALAEINNDEVTTVDNYGLAFSPATAVSLPNLEELGNFAFYKAKLASFNLASDVTVGYNLFTESEIETLVIEDGRNEIPMSLAKSCAKLANVTLPSTATNIMKDAFADCVALESMEIPVNVNYMEPGAVPTTIKSLRVLNVNPPVLADDVFNESQGEVECKVAAKSVEKFQAAAQWNYLNIVADASITGKGSVFGCPTGLYFATKDGRLMYKNEEGEVIDTEFKTGAHAFNLASYKNRIYVGSAGKNFRYEDAAAQSNGGDGEVFYVNNTNGIFYRVTVLNNVGYKAFEDPFSLSILEDENKVVIADRNVGIHEMDADRVGLYGSQPFLVQNNQLKYYVNGTAGMMYGGIGCGFYKIGDTYWMGKKFNGFGIYRFRKSDIAEGAATAGDDPFKVILPFCQMTQFYVDVPNGYIYFYLQSSAATGTAYTPGVYRLPMSAVEAADAAGEEVGMAAATLIDDSPVLLEGAGDEITGVTQFTSNGENVFWAYIASTDNEKSVPNSVEIDPENPLHHSGIKCITAKPETPDEKSVVTFAVEGVEAYGVAGAIFVPTEDPEPEDVTVTGVVKAAAPVGSASYFAPTAGAPVEGATLTFTSQESPDVYTTLTNEEGEFAVDMPEGAYMLTITAEGFKDYEREMSVEEGMEPLEIDLEIDATGVKTVDAEKAVAKVEYISMEGRKADKAFQGVNLKVITYTDGSKAVVKEVK